ncbi:mechanosensitive ion channel domain-containing protein [Paraflavisolibacter sp. H34]|uniref:mechanosensitive ion channel family protein n=1 Tax=Huijunlia imazamoxiresistens TaxID=3127457 RepID=UPI0030167943
MNDFFQKIFFDNTLGDYLWTVALILLVLVLNRLISRYLARLLGKGCKRLWPAFDERTFTQMVVHPLSAFLIVTVTIIAFYRLNFPSVLKVNIYRYPLQRVVLSVGIIIQLLFLTWLMLRIIDFLASVLEKKAALTPGQTDDQLVVFFRDLLKVIIGIVGLLLILRFAFNYDVGNLLTGLSIVGAAVALALRESLENLIASFVIFFDKPFTVGDNVKVQNIVGKVEKVGLRSTRIRSEQKTCVSVPNKQMVDTVLDNHSQRISQRNELILHLDLETPSEKIEALMAALKSFLAGIKEVEVHNVWFQDIQLQAYTIQVELFVPAAYLSQFNSIRQRVNLFALRTMEEMEIEIAGKTA